MPGGLDPFNADRLAQRPAALAGDPRISAPLTAVMARIEAICREAKTRSGAGRDRPAPLMNSNPE